MYMHNINNIYDEILIINFLIKLLKRLTLHLFLMTLENSNQRNSYEEKEKNK